MFLFLIFFRFLFFNASQKHLDAQLNAYLKSNRRKCHQNSAGLVKFDWYMESNTSIPLTSSPTPSANSLSTLDNHHHHQHHHQHHHHHGHHQRSSRIQFEQRHTSSFINIKPTLTGSYAIDEELHAVRYWNF